MDQDSFIRVKSSTKNKIKKESLTFDVDGKPTESYDSIIRRAIKCMKGD